MGEGDNFWLQKYKYNKGGIFFSFRGILDNNKRGVGRLKGIDFILF